MENNEEKFICRNCGSESTKISGTCCLGKKREKACKKCGHLHDLDGSCDCGCSEN